MRKVIFVCLPIIFIACSLSPVPEGIIEPEKMQKVVYDLMQADEFFNSFLLRDTSLNLKKERSVYYEKIFKLHNTNKKEFYASFKYYQQHPDIQKVLFDSLQEKVKRKKDDPPPGRKPIKIATEM